MTHADQTKGETAGSFPRAYQKQGYAYELLNARIFRSMTQKELSARTGVSPEEISRIEGGGRNPTVRMLKRLADGLDMELRISLVPRISPEFQTEETDC